MVRPSRFYNNCLFVFAASFPLFGRCAGHVIGVGLEVLERLSAPQVSRVRNVNRQLLHME